MSISNAKEELVDHIADREVELVRIEREIDFNTYDKIEGSLDEVLTLLDFEYYSGFGGQEVYGYIWYTDGTWSERGEYDGSEWWIHKKRPEKDIKIERYL